MHRGSLSRYLIGLLALLAARPAAADMQQKLNTEAWDLEYEVTFKANGANRFSKDGADVHDTVSLESHFSTSLPLNMRNGGPNLYTLKYAMTIPQGTTPTAAQQQELMNLVMNQEIANWQYAPPGVLEEASETETAEALAEAGAAAARLSCTQVWTCPNFKDEMGHEYHKTVRTTRHGSGKASTATQLVFEMDAAGKRYLLSLAHQYGDQTNSLAKVVVITTSKGKAGDTHTDSTSQQSSLQYPEIIKIDDSTVMFGQMLCLDGTIDPAASSITGERIVPAHFDVAHGTWTVPGTLHVRYKLTPK